MCRHSSLDRTEPENTLHLCDPFRVLWIIERQVDQLFLQAANQLKQAKNDLRKMYYISFVFKDFKTGLIKEFAIFVT